MQTIGREQQKQTKGNNGNGKSESITALIKKPAKDPRDVNARNYGSYKKASLTKLVNDFSTLYKANPHGVAKILVARGVVSNHLLTKKLTAYIRNLKFKLTSLYADRKSKTKPNSKNVPEHVKEHYKAVGRIEAINEMKGELTALLATRYELPKKDSKFKRLVEVTATQAKERQEMGR